MKVLLLAMCTCAYGFLYSFQTNECIIEHKFNFALVFLAIHVVLFIIFQRKMNNKQNLIFKTIEQNRFCVHKRKPEHSYHFDIVKMSIKTLHLTIYLLTLLIDIFLFYSIFLLYHRFCEYVLVHAKTFLNELKYSF